MTEGLFILTTIFVAYVVYQVVNDKKKSTKSAPKESIIKAEKVEPPKPQVVAEKEKPAVAQPVLTENTAALAATQAPAAGKPGLRDPKTGEISTAYMNYRFTKRWIKDALVAEGLLTKVYKNNELNAETEAEIKMALSKLEAMDKYRP